MTGRSGVQQANRRDRFGTATVTTQDLHPRLRHDAKGGDCNLAIRGLPLATDSGRPPCDVAVLFT